MTNPPLSVPVKAGLDLLNRLGLTAESSMADNLDEIEDYADVLISAHAPATIGELRLNVAATDDAFRRESIDHISAYVDRASRFPNVRQVNIHFAPRRWVDDTQPRGQRGRLRAPDRWRPRDRRVRGGPRHRDRHGERDGEVVRRGRRRAG